MVTRSARNLFSYEAIRVEGFGIVPIFWIAMCDERRDEYQGFGRNEIAVYNIFGYCLAREEIRRWIQTQHFIDDLLCVGQFWQVVKRGGASVEHRFEFISHASLNLGILRQKIKCPRHGRGSGFM